MSNWKQKHQNRNKDEKVEDKERITKRTELLKLNNQTLVKICQQYKVKYDKNRTDEIIEKLLDKMLTKQNKSHRKNKKVKKLPLTIASDDMKEFKQEEQKQQHQMLLKQSSTREIINTDLTPLSENADNQQLYNIFNGNKNENDSVTDKQIIVSNNNNKNKHQKRKSIIDIIACAPKMNYDISDLHGFDTVKDIKDALPVDVKSTQCKLFYGGFELNDNKTLTQLEITNGSEIKVLISWREFKPDPKASHPKDMEHRHYDKVAELKRLNDFNIFSKLIIGIQRECNKNNEFIVYVGNNEQRVLHEYCICLSGDRTYDRKWTPLHSLCYNYQNDIEMVVNLLREHNIDNNNDDDVSIITIKTLLSKMFESKQALVNGINSKQTLLNGINSNFKMPSGDDFSVMPLIGEAFCDNSHTGTGNTSRTYANILAVGAHHGESMLSLSTNICTHSRVRIYGFEGQSKNFEVAFNKTERVYDNMKVFNYAMSDKPQINVPFTSADLVAHGGLFKHFRGLHFTNYINVSTFDIFVNNNKLNIDIVDYAVLDVEGWEINIILGMHLEKNLKKFPMFQFENGDTWYDERSGTNLTHISIMFYLESFGYELYRIGDKALYKTNWRFYYSLFVLCRTRQIKWINVVGGNMLALNRKYVRNQFKPSIFKLIDTLRKDAPNIQTIEAFFS
eukprot:146430_1